MALDKGWVYFGYGGANQIQIQCEDFPQWDIDDTGVKIIQIPNDSRMGYTLAIIKRVVKIINVFFDNYADFKLFLSKMKTLNSSGPWKLRVKRDSAGNWTSFDGTNDDLDVLYMGIKGNTKPVRGDEQFWTIKQIILGEAA